MNPPYSIEDPAPRGQSNWKHTDHLEDIANRRKKKPSFTALISNSMRFKLPLLIAEQIDENYHRQRW
jgi:hypothetical protein